MANRAGVADGHEEVVHGKVYGLHVTRRAFGEVRAGDQDMKTANALGLAVPNAMQLLADEIIE